MASHRKGGVKSAEPKILESVCLASSAACKYVNGNPGWGTGVWLAPVDVWRVVVAMGVGRCLFAALSG